MQHEGKEDIERQWVPPEGEGREKKKKRGKKKTHGSTRITTRTIVSST